MASKIGRGSWILPGVVVLLASLPGGPVRAGGYEGDPARIAAVVTGEVDGEGTFVLGLQPGPAMTRVLRVYSQPSHTPLAFVASVEFSESAEGQAWQAGWEAEPLVFGELGDLSAGALTATVERPPGDTGIEVWVWGLWPDGIEEERLVGDADVGSGSFRFFSAPGDPLGLHTSCCGQADGSEVCVVCTTPAVACEPTPACGN